MMQKEQNLSQPWMMGTKAVTRAPGGRERADAAFDIHVQTLPQELQKRGVILGLHEHVHVGEAGSQGFLLPAGTDHATHKGNDPLGVVPFQRLERSQHGGDLVLGVLPDDARVDDQEVSRSGAVRGRKAELGQSAF